MMMWPFMLLAGAADRVAERPRGRNPDDVMVILPEMALPEVSAGRRRCVTCRREYALGDHDEEVCAREQRRLRGTVEAREQELAAQRALWGPRGRPTNTHDPRLNLPKGLRPPPGVDRIAYVELLRRGLTRDEALLALELGQLPVRELHEVFEQAQNDPTPPDERRVRILRILEVLALQPRSP